MDFTYKDSTQASQNQNGIACTHLAFLHHLGIKNLLSAFQFQVFHFLN
jgi:hypothetical protein